MMKEFPAAAPAEIVINVSTALLAIVTGVGAAFGLWLQLHHTAAPGVLTASAVALGTGLALVGLALQRPSARLFLVLAGAALVVAFFSAPGAFASLIA
jgi:hypothetical protein